MRCGGGGGMEKRGEGIIYQIKRKNGELFLLQSLSQQISSHRIEYPGPAIPPLFFLMNKPSRTRNGSTSISCREKQRVHKKLELGIDLKNRFPHR